MAELSLVEKVIALEGVDLLAGLTPEQLANIATIATEAEFPPVVECTFAAKVARFVWDVVELVCVPVQAVPGLWTVHVYSNPSPAESGVATDGPPVGLKSLVTFNVMLPPPPVAVVRT